MKRLSTLGALFLTATLASAAWIPGWSTTNTPAAASNYVFSVAKAATNGLAAGTGSSNITDNAYTAVVRNLTISTNLFGLDTGLTNASGQTIAQQLATNKIYGSNIVGTISASEIDVDTLVVTNSYFTTNLVVANLIVTNTPIFNDTGLTNASGQTIAQAITGATNALANTNWVLTQVAQLGSTHYFTANTNSGALGGRTNNFVTWLTVPSTVTTQSFQTPIASAYIRHNVSTNTYSIISSGPADVLSYIYRTGSGTLTLHYELYAFDTVSNVLYELAVAPDQTIPTGGGPVAYEFPMNVASDFIATNATKLVVACKMGSSVGTSTPLLSFVNGGQYGAHFSFSRPLSSAVIQGSQITGPVANATTASYVTQQPLTNDISGIVRYSTNLTTMAPDWNLKYSTITTNAAWVFLAPLNFVATEFQSSVIFVTNSTASAVAVTAPAGWHTQGTWYCTNVTTFTVSHYGTIFTNAIAFPLW